MCFYLEELNAYSELAGRLLDTQTQKITPQYTQIIWEVFFLDVNFKHVIEVFQLDISPMALYMNIMHYFIKEIWLWL